MTQGAQGQEGRGAEPAWRLLLGQGTKEDEKTEYQHGPAQRADTLAAPTRVWELPQI